MNDLKLGLFRLMSYTDRDKVEMELGVSFEDLYDHLDGLRFVTRELETLLNTLFHGEDYRSE